MHAILLRLELFRMLSFFAVVDLEGVVVAGHNGKLACVVEVERGDRGARTTRLETLINLSVQCSAYFARIEAYSCWPKARYDVAHFLSRRPCRRGRWAWCR